MALVTKLSNSIKQYGFINFISFALSKLGEKLGYYHVVYFLLSKDLSHHQHQHLKPLANGFYLEEFTSIHIDALKKSWLTEQQLFRFKNRLTEGENIGVGIYSKSNKELAYYFWISFEKYELPDHLDAYHGLQLNSDEAYLYDGFCNPTYRGLGLHGYAASYLMNKAKDAGRAKAITIIQSINKAALQSQQKVGFQPVKEISFKGFKSSISSSIRNL
jgi:hypothetical protein